MRKLHTCWCTASCHGGGAGWLQGAARRAAGAACGGAAGARAAARIGASHGRAAHGRVGAGCVEPEPAAHGEAGARALTDRLLAVLPSMLCYWLQFARHGKRIDVETADDSIAAHFLHLLHGKERAPSGRGHADVADSVCGARVQRFHIHSAGDCRYGFRSTLAICGAIGALKGPKHGGANEVALEIQQRYSSPDEAEADILSRVARAR